MRKTTGYSGRIIARCALIVLGVMVLAGSAAADGIDQVPCWQGETGNASISPCGPGMMDRYGYGMMNATGAPAWESVEIRAMGRPVHDEMQGLLRKGAVDDLTPAERERMVEILNQYPGASTMMMTRMAGGSGQFRPAAGYGPGGNGNGMMGGYEPDTGYGPGFMMGGQYPGASGLMNPFLFAFCILIFGIFYSVWLAAGILVIVWILRQLQKERNGT